MAMLLFYQLKHKAARFSCVDISRHACIMQLKFAHDASMRYKTNNVLKRA